MSISFDSTRLARRTSKLRPRGRRATLEHLEDRRVLAVDFASAFAVGGALSENVHDLALDGAGNTCVVGGFSGTVDFDPGPGIQELTGGGTFAAKYDPSGNLLWATRVGAANSWFNFGPEIAAGADGSVYVVGTFENTATFGSTTLTSAGDDDAYVVKLDPSGNFSWANRVGGAGADWGNDVAVDSVGNVVVMAETRSHSSGNPDATVAKMDAAGNLLWTNTVGASTAAGRKNTTNWARGFEITVDSAGDVYATGKMHGTIDFDAGAGATALSGTAFVVKLSSSGSLTWARTFDGSTPEPHDIAVDADGNVYTTGLYSGSVDFNPGKLRSQSFVLSAAYRGTYISALDASGNFRWAKSTGTFDTNNYAWSEAMTVDAQGGVYVSGWFVGTVDFDPSSSTFSLTSAGDTDAFVWQVSSAGQFLWAGKMGGATADQARGIGVDASGNVLVAGSFAGNADFDPGPSAYNLTSAGVNDFFVAKLTQSVTLAATSVNLAAEGHSLLDTSDNRSDNERSHISRSAAVDLAVEELDDNMDELLSLLV